MALARVVITKAFDKYFAGDTPSFEEEVAKNLVRGQVATWYEPERDRDLAVDSGIPLAARIGGGTPSMEAQAAAIAATGAEPGVSLTSLTAPSKVTSPPAGTAPGETSGSLPGTTAAGPSTGPVADEGTAKVTATSEAQDAAKASAEEAAKVPDSAKVEAAPAPAPTTAPAVAPAAAKTTTSATPVKTEK